jgi:hypothetical protein
MEILMETLIENPDGEVYGELDGIQMVSVMVF